LLVPATAAHASARDVVRDCTDNGRIDSPHSPADYKGALHNLPSDVDEYTDCRQIIEGAQRRDAGRGSGGGAGVGGGGGVPPTFPGGGATAGGGSGLPQTAAEKNAIDQIGKNGGGPVSVAGQPIVPGGSGITSSAFRHSLPAPLIVLLVLLGLGALGWAVTVARARGINPPVPVLRALERVFPRRA
jgi:hypothetical protein